MPCYCYGHRLHVLNGSDQSMDVFIQMALMFKIEFFHIPTTRMGSELALDAMIFIPMFILFIIVIGLILQNFVQIA